MSQDRLTVEQQIKRIGKDTIAADNTVAHLAKTLGDGETILEMRTGYHDKDNVLLVVTDERMLMLIGSGHSGDRQLDIPYSQITCLLLKRDLFGGEIEVSTAEDRIKIEKLRAPDVDYLASLIQGASEHAKGHASRLSEPQQPAAWVERLEELFRLRERGVLTTEQYIAEKNRLFSPCGRSEGDDASLGLQPGCSASDTAQQTAESIEVQRRTADAAMDKMAVGRGNGTSESARRDRTSSQGRKLAGNGTEREDIMQPAAGNSREYVRSEQEDWAWMDREYEYHPAGPLSAKQVITVLRRGEFQNKRQGLVEVIKHWAPLYRKPAEADSDQATAGDTAKQKTAGTRIKNGLVAGLTIALTWGLVLFLSTGSEPTADPLSAHQSTIGKPTATAESTMLADDVMDPDASDGAYSFVANGAGIEACQKSGATSRTEMESVLEQRHGIDCSAIENDAGTIIAKCEGGSVNIVVSARSENTCNSMRSMFQPMLTVLAR